MAAGDCIKCFLIEKTGNEKKEQRTDRYHGEEHTWEETLYEYRRTDTGETKWISHPFSWEEPGCMFVQKVVDDHGNGEVYPGNGQWNNDDGNHLWVLTPGGHWDIDNRAGNCGNIQDRLHRCWTRHGIPPNITVTPGCPGGGGSIRIRGAEDHEYHAMLENGVLREV